MSTLAPSHDPTVHGSGPRPLRALRFAWRAWRSITAQELRFALMLAVMIAAINFVLSMEIIMPAWKHGRLGSELLRMSLATVLITGLGLLTWVLADRAPEGGRWSRPQRMAAALLATALIWAAAGPWILFGIFGDANPCDYLPCAEMGFAAPPIYLRGIGEIGYIVVFGGFAFALVEFRCRQRRVVEALAAARDERSRLNRATMDSQLAAMQAQVEPQFLFDSLLDVQALYDRDAASGATTLDRLIEYLRTALPRLRESGSTLAAEADLLRAYLSVVAARHEGKPATRIVVSADTAGARFHPMLLLPLVQRAVRHCAPHAPERIELVASKADDRYVAVLRISACGRCADDTELTRVRERLAGLFDARATLDCAELPSGTTEFTLSWPDEPGDRDRR